MKQGNIILLLICTLHFSAFCQKIALEAFVRLPHVVNYNFNKKSIGYSSAISGGLTIRYNRIFENVGSLISKENTVGHYSFFGSTLSARQPVQKDNSSYWVKTVGVSPVIVKNLQHGAFAAGLTIGPALRIER